MPGSKKKEGAYLHSFEKLPPDPRALSAASSPTPAATPPKMLPPEPTPLVEEPRVPEPLPRTSIEITGKSKKGKWQAAVVEGAAIQRGVVEGQLPADICPGAKFIAEVLNDVPHQWVFRIIGPL